MANDRVRPRQIDELIAAEEAALEPRHRASIAYREIAERHVAGGVASRWQDSPPARGLHRPRRGEPDLGHRRQRVPRLPPRLRRDGDRARAPEDRRGDPARRRRLRHPLRAADAGTSHEVGENLADRFKLPLWRFANSGTEATLEAIRLMRANTGRDMIIKIEGSYHGHHDSIMFSVAPDRSEIGPREHPVTVPQAMGIPQAFADLVRVVPFNDLTEAEARVRGEPREDRRADHRAGDDELRRDPARARLPPGPEGPVPRERRVPRVRRGEDRRDARLRRRGRGRSASTPDIDLPRQGDRRRPAVRRDRRDARSSTAR